MHPLGLALFAFYIQSLDMGQRVILEQSHLYHTVEQRGQFAVEVAPVVPANEMRPHNDICEGLADLVPDCLQLPFQRFDLLLDSLLVKVDPAISGPVPAIFLNGAMTPKRKG